MTCCGSDHSLSLCLLWVQVLASLVSNMISVVLGLVGVAYVCWLLANRPASERICETLSTFQLRSDCTSRLWLLDVSLCLYCVWPTSTRTFTLLTCYYKERWPFLVGGGDNRLTCVYVSHWQSVLVVSGLWVFQVPVYGSLGLLLVLLVLHVCVAVTVCVFSGKAIRHRDRYTPVMVRCFISATMQGHVMSVCLSGQGSVEVPCLLFMCWHWVVGKQWTL